MRGWTPRSASSQNSTGSTFKLRGPKGLSATKYSGLACERKQVIVLFADVKGSMDLAESIDPEEWYKILDRFFTILADGVHRFEGTVNQYAGDGIMALFGAPIAYENHVQRASCAAPVLQEDLCRYANELRVEKGISFRCDSLLARYGGHLRRITVAPRRRPLRRSVRGRARPC